MVRSISAKAVFDLSPPEFISLVSCSNFTWSGISTNSSRTFSASSHSLNTACSTGVLELSLALALGSTLKQENKYFGAYLKFVILRIEKSSQKNKVKESATKFSHDIAAKINIGEYKSRDICILSCIFG